MIDIVTLSGLPHTDGEAITAANIKSVTAASDALRKGLAVTSAGDYGALNVHKGDDDLYHCEAMRYRVTVERKDFKYLAAAVEWVKEWLPKLNDKPEST